jgi:hypothetical protein
MTTSNPSDDAWAAFQANVDRLQADVDAVAVFLRSKRSSQPVRLAAQVIGRDPLQVCLLVDPVDLRPVAVNVFAALGYGTAPGWKVDNFAICEAGEPQSSHQAMAAYEKVRRALGAARREPK